MWCIENQFYDLTNFIDQHPGGRLMIEAMQGSGECAQLILQYHPNIAQTLQLVNQ